METLDIISLLLIETFGKLVLLKLINIVELSSNLVISKISPAPKLKILLTLPIDFLFKSMILHPSKSE